MLNQIQENPFVINAPTTAAYDAGDVVIESNVIGVAIAGGESGDTIAVVLAGVVQLSSINSVAFDFGDALYWDTSAAELTKVSTSNTFLGFAALAKLASTAVGQVFLAPLQAPA